MSDDTTHKWDRAADLEAIEATYARYAESGRAVLWDERNDGYRRLAGALRDALIDELRASVASDGTRILDLGCGTGELAAVADELPCEVDWVGVDLRADAIAAAGDAYPHARFVQASADAVPEQDATFDIVVAQVLFSSLPSANLERAVASEVGRLMRPGGWLVWSDIRFSNPSNPAVHGLGRRRVMQLFPGWQARLRSMGLLPPVARRLGPLAAIAYPILSAIPPLRSHYVGRLRRPAGHG